MKSSLLAEEKKGRLPHHPMFKTTLKLQMILGIELQNYKKIPINDSTQN